MRVKYTKTAFFMALCAVLVLVLVGLGVFFACEGEIGGCMAVALVFAIVAVGLWFYFHFGIFVGKTRATVYDGETFKIFCKDEIKYIKVDIHSDWIAATVRVNSKESGWQNHEFLWGPVRALRGRRGFSLNQFLVVDDSFVQASTERLSRFEKASVQDKREV